MNPMDRMPIAAMPASAPGPSTATNSMAQIREFTDRLVEWLETHRDIPSFVYLHFFDPHPPYEPNRPYDTLWADPNGRDEYLREQEVLKKFVADPFLAQRGMATRDELLKAGLDPEKFLQHSKDWYDGSIRGMDDEIARLVAAHPLEDVELTGVQLSANAAAAIANRPLRRLTLTDLRLSVEAARSLSSLSLESHTA